MGCKKRTISEYEKDVVPFSVADMEFKNAPEIIEGLKKRLDNLVLECALLQTDFTIAS